MGKSAYYNRRDLDKVPKDERTFINYEELNNPKNKKQKQLSDFKKE